MQRGLFVSDDLALHNYTCSLRSILPCHPFSFRSVMRAAALFTVGLRGVAVGKDCLPAIPRVTFFGWTLTRKPALTKNPQTLKEFFFVCLVWFGFKDNIVRHAHIFGEKNPVQTTNCNCSKWQNNPSTKKESIFVRQYCWTCVHFWQKSPFLSNREVIAVTNDDNWQELNWIYLASSLWQICGAEFLTKGTKPKIA